MENRQINQVSNLIENRQINQVSNLIEIIFKIKNILRFDKSAFKLGRNGLKWVFYSVLENQSSFKLD